MNVFDDAWGDGYPDSGKLTAMAMSESHRGGPLWTWHRFDDAVDFFDGEAPGGPA